MHTVIFLFVMTFGCSSHEEAPNPNINLNEKKARLEAPEPESDPVVSGALHEMVRQAHILYGEKSFRILTLPTDTWTTFGVYAWRSCARFTIDRLGVPISTPHLFLDQDLRLCDKNSNMERYVLSIIFTLPSGDEYLLKRPSHGDDVINAAYEEIFPKDP